MYFAALSKKKHSSYGCIQGLFLPFKKTVSRFARMGISEEKYCKMDHLHLG